MRERAAFPAAPCSIVHPARTIGTGILFWRSAPRSGLFEHIIPRARAKIFAWSNRLIKSRPISQINSLSFPRGASQYILPPLPLPPSVFLHRETFCLGPLLLLAWNSSHAAGNEVFRFGSMERKSRRDSARHFLLIIDRQTRRRSFLVIVSMIQKQEKKNKAKRRELREERYSDVSFKAVGEWLKSSRLGYATGSKFCKRSRIAAVSVGSKLSTFGYRFSISLQASFALPGR